jgi:hypothetical protein
MIEGSVYLLPSFDYDEAEETLHSCNRGGCLVGHLALGNDSEIIELAETVPCRGCGCTEDRQR